MNLNIQKIDVILLQILYDTTNTLKERMKQYVSESLLKQHVQLALNKNLEI